jgi:hypothetical protein
MDGLALQDRWTNIGSGGATLPPDDREMPFSWQLSKGLADHLMMKPTRRRFDDKHSAESWSALLSKSKNIRK